MHLCSCRRSWNLRYRHLLWPKLLRLSSGDYEVPCGMRQVNGLSFNRAGAYSG